MRPAAQVDELALTIKRNILAGGNARLRSPDGVVEVTLELDPTQRRDVVVCRKGGWWKTGHSMSPLLKNRFTPGGGVAYNETSVRLEPTSE